jgi:hypothetical protein
VQTDSSSSNTSGGSDSVLKFANYEAFMLRLHRLILPEFDVAASRDLIHDDWARDPSGKDHLDYSFFHLSMFELVGEGIKSYHSVDSVARSTHKLIDSLLNRSVDGYRQRGRCTSHLLAFQSGG